jgi:glutaredoxin
MTQLRLLTRPGCHLCDAMKALVATLPAEHHVELVQVDITGHRELERQFGNELPVLMLGEEAIAKVRTTRQTILDRLSQNKTGAHL